MAGQTHLEEAEIDRHHFKVEKGGLQQTPVLRSLNEMLGLENVCHFTFNFEQSEN